MVFTKDSALQMCVLKGDVSALIELINGGLDVHNKDYCLRITDSLVVGVNALHVAVFTNDINAAVVLLRNGVNVNAFTGVDSSCENDDDSVEDFCRVGRRDRRLTALHIAAIRRAQRITELLIDFGADVNARDERGVSVLEMAVRDAAISATLIASGADIATTGKVPLIIAAIRAENVELVAILADLQSEDDDYYSESAIEYAIDWSPKCVSALIEHSACIAERNVSTGEPLLHIAIRKHEVNWIKLLLARGFNANIGNRDGNRALHIAVYSKCSEHVFLLLFSRGANPNLKNKFGFAPLLYAIEDGFVNLAQLLLRYGARVSPQLTELRNAITMRRWESVIVLLEHSRTPLRSVRFDNESLIWYFLRYCIGVSDNIETLSVAFEMLCESDCDLNQVDPRWGTLMHYLVYATECQPSPSYQRLFSILLERENYDINQVFTAKRFMLQSGEEIFPSQIRAFGTALEFALSVDDGQYFAEQLIRFGADVNSINWSRISFTPQNVRAFKMLFYSGSQFPHNFVTAFDPLNDDKLIAKLIENSELRAKYENDFKAFVSWMSARKAVPLKLKCICRQFIRNIYGNEITVFMKRHSDVMPIELIEFVNFENDLEF